jgi:hypothetical protein
VPPVIACQKGETQLIINETTIKGRRYVWCNEEGSPKDAERRRAIVTSLERTLNHGTECW